MNRHWVGVSGLVKYYLRHRWRQTITTEILWRNCDVTRRFPRVNFHPSLHKQRNVKQNRWQKKKARRGRKLWAGPKHEKHFWESFSEFSCSWTTAVKPSKTFPALEPFKSFLSSWSGWSRVMAHVLLLIAVFSAFVIVPGVRCAGENISSLPNERSLDYVPKKSESDRGEDKTRLPKTLDVSLTHFFRYFFAHQSRYEC